MVDTASTRVGTGTIGTMRVEIHTGTTGAASTDALVLKTQLSKIWHVDAAWAEDIGGTAVTLDYTVSGGTVNIMTNSNLAKDVTVLVIGWP